jgi:hypothetical protein
MKHLLTGVAMAAALAIAAPTWAQAPAPMTPGGNNPTSGSAGPFAPKPAPAPAAPAMAKPAAMPMAKKPMHHHMMHSTVHKGRMHSGDSMTEQLNAQELQRITGGGAAPAPMPAPMAPGGNNPTSGSAGPFAPSGSAPPPPPK